MVLGVSIWSLVAQFGRPPALQAGREQRNLPQ
jgi:hypothetical protein